MADTFKRFLPAAALLLGTLTAGKLAACPFCRTGGATLAQQVQSADVALIGRCSAAGAPSPENPLAVKIPFEILHRLKVDGPLASAATVEISSNEPCEVGETYLLWAVKSPILLWNQPQLLSSAAVDYLLKALRLPEKGPQRMAYFFAHLQDEDALLSNDAYNEFARISYDDLIASRAVLDRQQLLAWIADPATAADHRRLYLTMLGVCGRPEDAALVQTLLATDDPEKSSSLDAAIACYLCLTGPAGLPLVKERFIADPQAEFDHAYAAIQALRFHGDQAEVIPRPLILQTFHLMLERPELADLVLVDLIRWEDWEAMPRVVRLFLEADEQHPWVRVPALRYLIACPLPEAKAELDRLAALDPDAMRRAKTFSPFESQGAVRGAPADDGAGPAASATPESEDAANARAPTAADPNAADAEEAAQAAEQRASRRLLVGIPLLIAAVVAVLLLRAFRRTSE